ncbi:MAG: ATP-binding protein [Oscillospiraceae bacterium]|nr:ATP-binding protein [Oscillospiraceae bacterium]
MGRDGICRVQDKLYSKTIRFYDINYQLAQNEDKNAIFENWCDFLNYFDSTIYFQLSFINHKTNMTEYERVIRITPQGDDFDDVRMEYAEMLKNQLAKGNNGLMRSKYITFAVEADSVREARPKLERIEADILNNFKVLGVSAFPLNGVERLQIMYETFNPDQSNPFTFNYYQLLSNGLSTKDFIAPTSFTFRNGRYFMMGSTFGAASYLQILAPELTDKMLAEFLDMDKNLIVNLHVQSIEQMKAVKLVKSKVTDINRMKIEEQKKAVRSGYDMDIIPSDLMTYGNEAKRLLEDLQSRNERMFLVTVIFLNTANTKQELDNVVFQTAGIAQKYNCALRRLDYMQEQGLMSSLPLGLNQIPIKRALTTTSTAIFVPFTTQELFMEGESLYYGLNALSNNMIMVDRKKLKNPNGLILGTPGSGKSFSAKREITNAFFVTKDDIIICDPEGEYYPLVHALGGQVVHISPTSHDYINPMDINLDYSDDDNPLGFKSDFVLSLCELIMGSRDGIEAEEKSVIDRCLPLVYQRYFADPVPENMPVLGDLYDTLRAQKEEQAQRIATALEIYVNGSLKVFNHQTNVELGNRIICFDIKDLGKQLKKLGMLIVQDQVWNRVTLNRYEHKSTRYYVDEFHLLLKEEQTAAYSVEIWKRFRKWGGIPTGITQNIKDLLASREIENIFENSDFIYMLNQASGDRQILAKQLNISPYQLSYVTNSGEGEGLLFYGNIIIPFKDRFDKSLKLYSLMTTKPEEVEKRMESEEADDEDDTKTWHPSEVRAMIAKEAEAE